MRLRIQILTYAIADATERTNFIAAQIAAGRPYTTSGNNVTVTYKAGSIYINSTNYFMPEILFM